MPPILVIGNTHDPATPLRWARSLSARIQGSGLLIHDGDGHTAYRRSACATEHIDTYLVTGTLPATGQPIGGAGQPFGGAEGSAVDS
ncbi:alpha/beta hydrolase [Nonomuraea jabiensis]|uniref:alpha/beta hydrolase n=1 Tax=Nonomuraea jabiensis TaxID=882448 RepID=UPI0036964B8A